MVKSPDASGDRLPKQIGCKNGIFQLFDRRLLFVGRHHHERLLAVAGGQQQLEPHNATDLEGGQQQLEPHNATEAVIERDTELQKGRISQAASDASSSRSSTHALNRGLQCPDLRDVVKDSMYREARCVPVKSLANDGSATVMKHIDSPRLRVALPRFSYDGRESRERLKTNMKNKELPRFSLDNKAGSMKQQHSALGRDLQHMGNENSSLAPAMKTECGSHSQSSSIVTKLMGLEDLADSIATNEKSITRTPTAAARSPAKQVSSPQSVTRKNPASLSSRQHQTTSVRRTTLCSKRPLEPAPWKKQDHSPHRQKTATQSGRNPSSSVYGEIEKRITQLEFKRSGKDLRALKQILEAMQKTRQRLENQQRESAELKLLGSTSEDSCSNQHSSSSMLQPVLITKETFHAEQMSSSTGIAKLTAVMRNVKISSSTRVHRTQERENHRTPMNKNKKITGRNIESEHSAPQCIRVENCTTSGRGCGMTSPRMQHIVRKTERESHPNTSTSESNRAKKQLSKKEREKCAENGKRRVKSMDLQLSNDQLRSLTTSEKQCSSYHGDAASEKSESGNGTASHVGIDAISSDNLTTMTSRKQDCMTEQKQHKPGAELAVITMEQPSPISVLHTPFCIEGSPSPVKNISIAFQEDESSSHEGAEWNVNNLAACTDSRYNNNHKSENLLDSVHESRSLKTKPKEHAANNNETGYQSINPGNRYITKMLPAFGLLKDTSITQTDKDSHPVSSGDIFNSNMFHALQGEDAPIDDANEELIETNDHMKLNQKIQRKVVADAANEILVRKITSGRLFTMGRGRMSLQKLIKEVYLEIEQLSRMPYCHIDGEEDDRSIGALTVDMKHQSDERTNYRGEVPALVLDIERLIFKDLINEVITYEVSGSMNVPCRQLYTM